MLVLIIIQTRKVKLAFFPTSGNFVWGNKDNLTNLTILLFNENKQIPLNLSPMA